MALRRSQGQGTESGSTVGTDKEVGKIKSFQIAPSSMQVLEAGQDTAELTLLLRQQQAPKHTELASTL